MAIKLQSFPPLQVQNAKVQDDKAASKPISAFLQETLKGLFGIPYRDKVIIACVIADLWVNTDIPSSSSTQRFLKSNPEG